MITSMSDALFFLSVREKCLNKKKKIMFEH